MEEEPSLPLEWGDETLEMTPHNSMLYTFIGRTAVKSGNDEFLAVNSAFNHVWVTINEDQGVYFWAEHDAETYTHMAAFMVKHEFPMMLNNREVPACDIQAWLFEVDEEVEIFVSGIPDEI